MLNQLCCVPPSIIRYTTTQFHHERPPLQTKFPPLLSFDLLANRPRGQFLPCNTNHGLSSANF